MPRKRTKAKPVAKKQPQGVGDTLEKITEATGIKKIVEKVFPDCGCKQRKEWLNKTFPYVNSVPKCMTEDQYEYYKGFRETYIGENKKGSVPHDEMKKVLDLYNSIFQVDIKGCTDCNANIFVERLDKVYLAYQENQK